MLGCVADDQTGATDLGLTLKRGGLKVVQVIGVPGEDEAPPEADAVVVALKSRMASVEDAVSWSRAAAGWLKRYGAQRLYSKICSTFDSTDRGNIGPVTEALLKDIGEDFVLVCPAFPATGRTVYAGHLFIGSALLSETDMGFHPLTPMTDPNLVRVLGRQMKGTVGRISYNDVCEGAEAIREAIARERRAGHTAAIADAINVADLTHLAEGATGLGLLVGGAGLASGLPNVYRRQGLISLSGADAVFQAPIGKSAIIAGSCSTTTLEQIEAAKPSIAAYRLNPLDADAAAVLAWAEPEIEVGRPVLIYASAGPEGVMEAQRHLGEAEAGVRVEQTLAETAAGLVNSGITRLVIAGGETSGAVINRLGIRALEIGPEIDPGVPWTRSVGRPALALALKSGNFGSRDFFIKALEMLA